MSQPGQLLAGVSPFPGYTLVRTLGKGGWGEVWMARDPAGEHLALKFVQCDSHLAAAQEVRALQSIRQLSHPGLTRIHQVWCWSGHVVIAMELAQGTMLDLLDQYCKDFGTCIIPDHLCQFLMPVAEAIDFLNTRQHRVNDVRVAVRHCDIKPSNLLVFDDKIKLADFSLASITTSPMVNQHRVGTLSYAAPEIFQGQLSERSDLYSLAVTYFELRTGQLPFNDTPDHFTKGYVRPEPDLYLVSAAERTVLRRGLAPVPQDRWHCCREMIERLAKATSRLPIPC